jgi:hypothetical protein
MSRYVKDPADAWDSKTTNMLKGALDEAERRAAADGTKADKYGEPVRDALAKHIVSMAKRGERDEKRLVEGALERLRQ